MKKLILLSAISCMASASFAQISSIGVFSGSMSEGFESFPTYGSGGNYDTLGVMGGGATFASNPVGSNQLWVYGIAGDTWGLSFNGTAQVNGGSQGFGLYNSLNPVNVTLTFGSEVSQFGGWFASDTNNGNVVDITFYDLGGTQIGATQQVSTNSGVLVWFGWQSTIGVKSVSFGTNWAPVMDDLQANPVPEPASVLALCLGVGLMALRRRKA